jgi:hypothetical protein
MTPQQKYAVFVTVLMCTWLGCQKAAVVPTEYQPRHPMPLNGKQWLACQNSDREDFVIAYLSGHFSGVKEACEIHDGLAPTISCRAKAPRYSYRSDSAGNPDLSKYTSVLTKFYTEHSEYQFVPCARLMEYLTDDQHKTADDLYSMAKAGEFPAMGGSLGIGTQLPSE